MATNKTDLSKLNHTLVNAPLHFYSEVLADGTEVLRHVRVQQRTFAAPTDGSGITIDVVPPDSVGSAQIEDGSVQMADLSPEAREAMENQFATNDDVKAALGLQ